ncbi:2-dehydropantoate 2-reductase [Prauserella sediminis]|uniref:2-dehydropantoate 2-reductase n=1 Tax=Prauserella sediminis TaxID=577680 RepID=A0A839XI81_9PSEU|nr:2-dehydropantoate 2-reductase [Prauserella sediminis]MBB3662471.1 2-dehydropantoate 2-reductase [Prauserella sediminis]
MNPGVTGGVTVAVVGMGAVGTALAGALAAAGHDVVACGRRPLSSIEVVGAGGTATYPVRWAAEPADVGPVALTILATKIHDTGGAAGWLAALTSTGGDVLVAQNGVDQAERVGPLIGGAGGSHRGAGSVGVGSVGVVVPALVYVNAERVAPGVVRTRRSDCDLVVPGTDEAAPVADLLAGAGLVVERSADFATAAWRKMLTNVSANPITALTGRRVEVLAEQQVAELAMRVLTEAVAVANAEGARLTDADARDVLTWLQTLAPGSTTSMLQDRDAGRPLEHDGLTGTVVRLGDRHGIDVGANRTLLSLLSAVSPAAGSASR